MRHLHSRTIRVLACLFLWSSSASAVEFVRLAQGQGGSWCFEHAGKRFFSMGICHIAARGEPQNHQGRFYDGGVTRGGMTEWATSVATRMGEWGFNTAGSWCDEPVYGTSVYATRYLWLSAEVDGISARLLNVFSPGYEARVDALCKEFVAPHKDDARLIGWFLDNELPWYGDFGWPNDLNRSLLDLALQRPASDPNRKAAVRFLQTRYVEFTRFAHDWETQAHSWDDLAAGGAIKGKTKAAEQTKSAWAGQVAERFFRVAVAAVRKHDPNHLILGCRFAGNAPGPVIAACAKHCDVVSMNHYAKNGDVDPTWWDDLYALTQKPILLTEFSWRATENRSGNRNTHGVDVTVPTQADRAERYGRFVPAVMKRPYLLGTHWFEWADEPENGRFDGEDSNYGLVDYKDNAYEPLVAAARSVHAGLPSPDASRGPLPGPRDRDGLTWGAKRPAVLPTGTLRAPVEFAPAETAPSVALDAANGSVANVRRESNAWLAEYDTGTGWGLTLSWPTPAKPLPGAATARLTIEAPPGTKFSLVLAEKKADPTNKSSDGESWILGPLVAEKGVTHLDLDLHEMERNAYDGNQHGNRRVDLEGLTAAGVYFHGAQGKGHARITSLLFDR